MIKYNDIPNCKLVRGIISLPKTPRNKGLGIILNTNNYESTKNQIRIMQKRFINAKFIKSFYSYSRFRFRLFNQSINEKINIKELYTDIRDDKTIDIQNMYKNLNAYKNNNLFISMHQYNVFFNDLIGKTKGARALKQYKYLVDNFNTTLPNNYNKLIMVIDLKELGIDLKKLTNYSTTECNNIFSFLYVLLKDEIEYFNKLPYDLLFIYDKYKIKLIPSECTKDSYKKIRKEFNLIQINKDDKQIKSEINKDDKINTNSDLSKEDKKDIITGNIINAILPESIYDNSKYYFTGINSTIESIEDDIKDKMDDIDIEEMPEEEIREKVIDSINNDEELLNKIDLVTKNSYTANLSNADIKRNKVLQEKQLKIQINKEGKTVQEIFKDAENKKLDYEDTHITTINDDLKQMKFNNFTKNYNKNVLESDIMHVFESFNDKRYPMYLLDIKKEDTSDDFNKKYTYTAKYEAADRSRHTITIDIPKFVNDSYLYLGGNKKYIINQLILLPVSKTGPNTVQLCSCAYNKIFLTRAGIKVTPKIEKMKKTLAKYKSIPNKKLLIKYKLGDNSLVNTKFITNMEYDEFAKEFMYIELTMNKDKYTFYFNQINFRNELNNKNIKIENKDTLLPIGIKNDKEVIYLDTDTDFVIPTQLTFVDYIEDIISKNSPEFIKDYQEMSVGKKFMYTQATIMSTKIPILLLLSYLEGLTSLLKKANINHYFSDTRPVLKGSDKNNKGIISFSDGYLVYDRYPMKNSLLMNAFSIIPTKNYKYSEFDSKEVYLDIFYQLYANKKILNALENFYDLFIDPITLEVLKDLNLPTGFVELVLYGNELLQDNQFIRETDRSHYRIRNNEIIVTGLYKILSNAYSVYRSSVGNKNPKQMSVPRDLLIKNLLTDEKAIQNSSKLNPILEAEELRSVSFRGQSGMNAERAFTLDKRIYDSSMKGIIAMSTSPSGSVGITRQLALDCNVLSTRGYLKGIDSLDDLNTANMFSAAELMSPGTAQFDDGSRVAMTSNQSKQLVPCKKFDRLIISSGAEKAISQVITDDFAFKAKQDGKVIDYNENDQVMIIEYKDGTKDIIDLGSQIVNNSNGGFFIDNKLVSNLKVGNKFKEGDILAANGNFFELENDTGDAACKTGTLAKVAMTSASFTYEDSSMPTEKLSEKLSTSVIMKKSVVLGKNSNVTYICKKGNYIEVGDPLIVFDESFEDDTINKLLANMNKDAIDKLTEMGKVPVKSKYSGEIVDIKVYYGIDKSEMSPSLRNTVTSINKDKKEKRAFIEKYVNVNQSNLILDPVDKVDMKYGKIKGETVNDGVLIEFYVKYFDKLGVGDKITTSSSLKTVNCKICPEGYEAYSEYRKDEEISMFLSPISYLSRMTKHVDCQLFGNKVMIELKRKVAEIYNR